MSVIRMSRAWPKQSEVRRNSTEIRNHTSLFVFFLGLIKNLQCTKPTGTPARAGSWREFIQFFLKIIQIMLKFSEIIQVSLR